MITVSGLFDRNALEETKEIIIMAFKSKSSPKRNCVTQLHDYLNKYVTYDSDVCSYELISLSSSIPVKEFSISLLAAEI